MPFPILLAASAVAQTPIVRPFPEPTIGMVGACLSNAVENKEVSRTKDSWKYMCSGEPAETLWNHLVALKVEPWEQVVPEGTWLTREFPLGGCFKRAKDPDGNPTTEGLSCSIWVPHK